MTWKKASHCGTGGHCVEVGWGKSSHSFSNSNCVEVGWAKSSHSGASGCLEAGSCACGGEILVHDTKECSDPDHCTRKLAFSPKVWAAFLADIKAGGLAL